MGASHNGIDILSGSAGLGRQAARAGKPVRAALVEARKLFPVNGAAFARGYWDEMGSQAFELGGAR